MMEFRDLLAELHDFLEARGFEADEYESAPETAVIQIRRK